MNLKEAELAAANEAEIFKHLPRLLRSVAADLASWNSGDFNFTLDKIVGFERVYGGHPNDIGQIYIRYDNQQVQFKGAQALYHVDNSGSVRCEAN